MDKKCVFCGKPLDVFNKSNICEECKNSKMDYNEKVKSYNNNNQDNGLNILLTIFAFIGIINPVFLIIGLILGKNSLNSGNEVKGYKLLKIVSIIYFIIIIIAVILFTQHSIEKIETNDNTTEYRINV